MLAAGTAAVRRNRGQSIYILSVLTKCTDSLTVAVQ
jgi:hypothetical protein